MKVYGSKISYYTGKLETYLRYRSIPYDILPTVGNEKRLKAGAGVVQMPVVKMDDGRWMTDTTPMLSWLDGQYDQGCIYPEDPAMRFLALLIEDYADEWLWRPAMHYRWSFPVSRVYAAETLYRELIKGTHPIPRFLGLLVLKRRQLDGFVRGDGVSAQTSSHVEQSYLNALDRLQAIFEIRPFILGGRPTMADIGMMGPMFRHFGQDPDPSQIMRQRAPAVYEWVARMWTIKDAQAHGELMDIVDAPLRALLREISETHLVQLRENARGFTKGACHFQQTIQNCHYKRLPVSRYRVWSLEVLRREWKTLSRDHQLALKNTLNFPDCNVLWDDFDFKPSAYDEERLAPFNRAINVYGKGVPLK